MGEEKKQDFDEWLAKNIPEVPDWVASVMQFINKALLVILISAIVLFVGFWAFRFLSGVWNFFIAHAPF